MIKLIKNKEAIKRQVAKNYSVYNLLTKELSPNVSLVEGHAKKHHEITRGKNNDRVYYLLKGKMKIKNGDRDIVAEKGDVVFISENTEYEFQGHHS